MKMCKQNYCKQFTAHKMTSGITFCKQNDCKQAVIIQEQRSSITGQNDAKQDVVR